MIWVLFSCLAAFSQALRNAFQSQLSKQLNIIAVTLSRFLWAWPLAIIYLIFLYYWQPSELPTFSTRFYFLIFGAALMQSLATSLMVLLFKQKNYAIGAGLAKCEAPAAAIIGFFFFDTILSPLGWLGVLIGGVAVLLLSSTSGTKTLSPQICLTGLACSSVFALTSLWAREASLTLTLPFLHRGAWIVLFLVSIQSTFLAIYLALKDRNTLIYMLKVPRLVIMTSVASFVGSIGWFTAMTLKEVPYVKTVGQIEILFMVLISYFWLKEKLRSIDLIALALIVVAAILVIWF